MAHLQHSMRQLLVQNYQAHHKIKPNEINKEQIFEGGSEIPASLSLGAATYPPNDARTRVGIVFCYKVSESLLQAEEEPLHRAQKSAHLQSTDQLGAI